MATDSFPELIEKYKREYPWKHLKGFPEFAMKKLEKGVSAPVALVKIEDISEPNFAEEKNRDEENHRELIIKWIEDNLDYKTLRYIGW